MFKTTLLDLICNHKQQPTTGILTLSKNLDSILGNGIPLGHITELCGNSGTGKTQLCMQLCINVQIPIALGGLNGKAIFIDTRFGFVPARFEEITRGTLCRMQKLVNKLNRNSIQYADVMNIFTFENILGNVYVKSVNEIQQLISTIESLTEICEHDKKIKLIVIDSFSFLFKTIYSSHTLKCKVSNVLSILHSIISFKKIAVILTNDLTTELTETQNEKYADKVVPSLGDNHSHKVNQRIRLEVNPNNPGYFVAEINKYLNKPRSLTEFKITSNGLQ